MRRSDIGSPHGYPRATSIDELSAPRPFREPTEPLSATVTLHLLPARIGLSSSCEYWLEASLKSAHEAAGIPLGESSWINPAERLDWDLPRALSWTDYPVLATPRVRVVRGWKHFPRVNFADPNPYVGKALTEDDVFGRLQHVIVHLPGDVTSETQVRRRVALQWVASAMDFVDATPETVPVTLVADDGAPVGGRPELRSLTQAIAAWRRFHYCYAANFTAIGLKALETCMQTPDPESDRLADRLRGHRFIRPEEDLLLPPLRTRAHYHVRGMLDPIWLQALFALGRRGEIHVPFLGDSVFRRTQEALVTPPGLSFPAWVGTGRYPVRPLTTEEAWSVGHGLFSTRTLAARGDALVLSDTGSRFLDCLHTSSEDVDMPVRWAGRDLDAADGEAMDRWITRTFRKMKTRVNHL